MGRPSKYSEAIALEICERLAAGESLLAICKEDRFPAESTVRLWAIEDREGFSAKYARAREAQMDLMAEQILEIADDSSRDTKFAGENGTPVADGEWISRSKLRVDTRKWLMSKLAPKKYGDKMQVGGADDLPPIAVSLEIDL